MSIHILFGGKTGVVGFGPTNAAVKVLCLTTWRYPIVSAKLKFLTPQNHEKFYINEKTQQNYLFSVECSVSSDVLSKLLSVISSTLLKI